MSQRFGRNQRRRAREALAEGQSKIADLQMAISSNRETVTDLQQKIKRLERTLSTVANMMPNWHASLPPQPNNVGRDPYPGYAWRMRVQTSSSLEAYDFGSSEQLCRALVHDVDAMALRTDMHADGWRRMLHFRATCGDKALGYNLTHAAIRHTPRSVLIENVATEIARAFALQWVEMGWRTDFDLTRRSFAA